MAEMTLEQQRAIAVTRARMRLQQETPQPAQPEQQQPDEADILAGSPGMRFALGAASPALGLTQLGAEAVGAGGVTEHLKRLEQMKRRGMTPAAEVTRLKQSRELLAQMPGYEATIAQIDKQIADLGDSPSARPEDAGFDAAGLSGTVMSPAVLGAMKIPAAASVLGRSAQGAGIGAALGAASPVVGGDDYWGHKAAQTTTGAVLGGVIPPAIDIGRKAYQIGRKVIDPLLPGGAERGAARVLADVAGPKRAAIEAELAKNQVLVPGSQPTAPEAAARAGSPEFSALQRIAADHRPSVYSDIAKSQEVARQVAVQGVGKTPEALKAAEVARAATGRANYGAVADDVVVPADRQINAILDRPSMTKAIARAKELTAEQGGKWPGAGGGVTVQNMQNLKMALDDMVRDPATFGIGASEVNAIQKTRGEFVNWLSKASPKWERARSVYAQQSRPINEMQVGQELEKALTKPIGDGERSGVFASAIREAPRTIKRATGQPRFDELSDVLSPKNLADVKSVLADLSRKAEFDRLAPLGRAKAAEGAEAFGLPATGPLHQQYMIFKTVLGRVSKALNEKSLDTMADALQLPSATLKLLQSAPTAQRNAVIDQIIRAKIGRGAIAATTSMAGQGIDSAR